MAKTKKTDTAKSKAVTGRPYSYKPEYAAQAEKLAVLGATDPEVADFFGVDVRTIARWKNREEAFCQALKVGKERADERVVRSLYMRAVGYEHDEVDIRVINNKIVQTPIKKYYAPDTTACIFWLKNRDKANWRDRVEHTGADGGPIMSKIETNNPVEAAKAYAEIMKGAKAG